MSRDSPARDMSSDKTVTLWRPTAPEELALVEAADWKAWPPRLPEQPIFYPVLNEEYANERGTAGREVEVTVRHIAKLAGKRVTVYVNYKNVGTMLVNSYGTAHREWDTNRGQYVPFAAAGDPVRVRTGSGTLVASGTYHREYDD